jgi:hypothetical protein
MSQNVAVTENRFEDWDKPQSLTPYDKIAISLVINARGRACLIHDGLFEATPVWVKYLTDKRKIQLVYDNGKSRIIDYTMDEKLHKKLLNIGKILLVRTDNGKPIEGFDTTLIKE